MARKHKVEEQAAAPVEAPAVAQGLDPKIEAEDREADAELAAHAPVGCDRLTFLRNRRAWFVMGDMLDDVADDAEPLHVAEGRTPEIAFANARAAGFARHWTHLEELVRFAAAGAAAQSSVDEALAKVERDPLEASAVAGSGKLAGPESSE